MLKLSKNHNILPFPSATVAVVGAAPDKTHKFYKKAYEAFHNAKQRCENPGKPSYSSYGALGIKFLFKNFDELHAEIGFPSNKDESLDRISPHGHYAPGNVRWLNKKLQPLNKKMSKGASTLSIPEMIQKEKGLGKGPATRDQAWACWCRLLRCIARGYFTSEDRQFFIERGGSKSWFSAGWKTGQGRDFAEPPSHFSLPSLCWPGKTITIRGGPFWGTQYDQWHGTIPGIGAQLPEMIPTSVFDAVAEAVFAEGPGAWWSAQVSETMLDIGGFEGWMFLAACRLTHSRTNPQSAVFTSAYPLAVALGELGHPAGWAAGSLPALKATVLFIPDLQIDVGGHLDLTGSQQSRLASLLRFRREAGRRTLVGVQNPYQLSPPLRSEVLQHLTWRDASNFILPSMPDLPNSNGLMCHLPKDALTFEQMRGAMHHP